MTMRTSSASQQRQNLLDLQATQERMQANSTRITSGKRIVTPGEDPTGAALIMDFSASISANTQYLKQVDAASGFLTSTEDAVNGAVSSVMRLQELAVSGSSASIPEVNSILQNLLALANTQSQGKYLFSGTKTEDPPFGDAASPYTYQGNQADINLGVSASNAVTTNLTGEVFFQGVNYPVPSGADPTTFSADIFKVATDLANGLQNNNQTLVKQATTNLDAVLGNLNQALATLGGRQAGLQSLKDTLSGFNISLQSLQSGQQDTDYALAMTQYTQDQTIQSATLSVMAKVNKTNLFDYLA